MSRVRFDSATDNVICEVCGKLIEANTPMLVHGIDIGDDIGADIVYALGADIVYTHKECYDSGKE